MLNGINIDGQLINEATPLVDVSEQQALEQALCEDGVTLNLNGDVKVGSYIVNRRGVVQADTRSFYDEERAQEVPVTWFFTIMIAVFVLAELSGPSGYEGAEDSLAPPDMLRGTPAGLGSWESNSVLNGIGAWDFMKWLLIQRSRGTGFDGSMLLAICAGFIAALTPGILAGRGADKFFFGKESVNNMTPAKWAVGGIFGGINFVVSGGLNVTSLLKLVSAFKNYYRRISTCCAGDDKRVWRNQCVEFIAKIICIALLAPVLYAALLATIARGRSTYDFVAGIAGDGIANEVFALTGIPGFAMFLSSFLKLVLFIEGIIKFTLTKLVYRSYTSFSGIDIFINLLATSIAGTCAMFVYYNYDGLSAGAYKDDWGLGKVVMRIVTSLDAFLIPAASAAAANLVMRVPDIASYLAGISDYARYKFTNPAERDLQRNKAKIILAAYRAAHPGKEAEFAQIIETYFKRRSQGDTELAAQA